MVSKYIDGKEYVYCHSAKKYLPRVRFEDLPPNAVFLKSCTSYIPRGVFLEDKRKGKTLYHVHAKNGSHGKNSRWGSHLVFIVKE